MFSGNCRASYWVQYTDTFGSSIKFINDQWYNIFWSYSFNSYYTETEHNIEDPEDLGLGTLANFLKVQGIIEGKKRDRKESLSTQGSSKYPQQRRATLPHTTTIPRELAWITLRSLYFLIRPTQQTPPSTAGLTTPPPLFPSFPIQMDDRLTFPPVHTPAVIPHPNDLLVSLIKDEYSSSVRITNPLTPDTIPNNNEARSALHAMNCVHQVLMSPYNTLDTILDRPTWLRMVMETLASVHEGFHTMQLAAPDNDPPDSFCDLSTDELNTHHVDHALKYAGGLCHPRHFT